MGKASRKKKKLIQEGYTDQSRDLKSSKTSATPQVKEELRKPASKAILLLFTIIILLTSFAVYFNALSNGFVYDDTFQVLENRWIKDIKYIPEIFFTNVWSFKKDAASNYYRPLMHVIYMLNYHVFGLKPWGFHLVNILFHAGVSVLVFIIGLRLLRESQPLASTAYLVPSFIAALVFATHPIHTEAVTWIAGLPDLSFTFFYLLSFYLYIRSGTEFKKGYLLSVGLFFFAALCKEPALTLPIILIAYDYVFKKSKDRLSTHIMRYIPYVAVAGAYFILRFHALRGFAPLKRHAELNIYQNTINVFPLFSQYLEKLLLPLNLNAFHVFHPISSISEAKGMLSLVIAVAFVVFTFIALKKDKTAFFCLSIIVIPLLPGLYIPGVGENTFAERYLYLPSVGFVILLALFLTWIKVNLQRSSVSIITVSIFLIGLYSIGTISRNKDWKDDYALYTDMVKKSPDGRVPHGDLGYALYNKGLIDQAMEQLQIALTLDPNYAEAHNNLGMAYEKKGLTDKAVEHFQIALKLDPNFVLAHNNLGMAYEKKGLTDKAVEHFQIALKIDPYFAFAHNNLGVVFLNKGEIDKGIEQYQIALALKPDYSDAHNNLGIAFSKKGWIEKAIEQYQIALTLKPDYSDAHNNLGNAFFRGGKIDKAIEQYQAAIRLNPADSAYRDNLSSAYKQKYNR